MGDVVARIFHKLFVTHAYDYNGNRLFVCSRFLLVPNGTEPAGYASQNVRRMVYYKKGVWLKSFGVKRLFFFIDRRI